MGKTIIVKFKHEKETKGSHRFQEVNDKGKVLVGDDDGALIGTLYLRKKRIGEEAPETVELTLKIA